MAEPSIISADEPDPRAAAIGAKLLEDGFTLVFDAETGALEEANEAAIFQLELSEDGLSQYHFTNLCDDGGEDASDLWFAVLSGGKARWHGWLVAALSMDRHAMDCIAAITQIAGASKVVLHASPAAEAAAPVAAGPALRPPAVGSTRWPITWA